MISPWGALATLLDPPPRLTAEALMVAAGMTPDPWQRSVLTSEGNQLLLCSRQAGKSTVTAALALRVAMANDASLVLLLSPSQRQSGELHRKVSAFLAAQPAGTVQVARETALTLTLANNSRIVALPGSEETVRGFSGVSLLVIDEAARVDDILYRSLRPMLAVSGGRLVAMTTPWGRRGWFYDEWTHGGDVWHRTSVAAEDCPRISAEFLAEERRSLGGTAKSTRSSSSTLSPASSSTTRSTLPLARTSSRCS